MLAGVLTSCYFFKKKEDSKLPEEGKETIARVFDSYLYDEDLDGLLNSEHTPEDSIQLLKRYINAWIKNQVLLKKAEKNINSLDEINKKAEKYRYDLILFEYQRKYLNEKLNSTVTEEQILNYYNANKSNFELKQNIVKCNLVRLHKNTPKLKKRLLLFKSKRKKDQESFKQYVMQFSNSYSFDDNVWYDFNEVVNQTPFANYHNQLRFLKKNKIAQESDSSFVYLIKILDFKISDQISPLEFVKDRVSDIIINKRKVALLKELEDGVYKQAEQNKEFEIYE